jgi:WD40-like Beta Propeller Repeat
MIALDHGLLSRRRVCGGGVYGAALALSGCGGGGGGDTSPGAQNNAGSGAVNGGLAGTMYHSFTDQTFKVDLATGNVTEIRFRNQDTASGNSYGIRARYFDVSSDGKTLFFMDDLGTERLVAVDIETKAARTVFTVSRATDWGEVRLSPDGKTIAMVKDGINGGNGIQIFDLSGNLITYYKVNSGASNSISWTADNRLLYSNGGIYLTNPGDIKNSLRINTSSASSVSINPAGNKIVYASQGHIWTMGINGDNVQQVTTGDNAEFQARWSPDGKFIAFQSQLYGTNGTGGIATTGNIYYLTVIPADGKQYTLKRTGPSATGGGTVTGVLVGDGVIELKSKNTRNSDFLYDIPAYDMIWR